MRRNQQITALQFAANRIGGMANLAKELKITRQALYLWDKIPAERVPEISRITGVSRADLRPDLWGEDSAA